MANDFFNDLGVTITKTAKEIGERADIFIETQKLHNRAVSEKRMIEKKFNDLGILVYEKFVGGEDLEAELAEICEEITKRKTVIAGYKEEIARLKGRKICGGCGESIDRNAAFCPKCGTPCPVEDAEDIFEDEEKMAEEVVEAPKAAEEEEEAAEEAEKAAEEALEAAVEAEEVSGEAEEAAEEVQAAIVEAVEAVVKADEAQEAGEEIDTEAK